MSEAFYWGCESAHTAVGYLQTLRISEIRQTLELLGVHHVEVMAAVLIFLMLQFTKFTAVLLLACLIAFSIFYMWDTWFPEKCAIPSGQYTGIYGAGYGPDYEPAITPFNSQMTGVNQDSPNSYRDARTSALFPPFLNNEDMLPGDHSARQVVKRNRLQEYTSASNTNPYSPASRATMVSYNRPTVSGAVTPIGHRGSINEMRQHRRSYNNQFDDLRYSRRPGERDPQAFRRMIANEYRAFRPGAATELSHRYSPFEDQRMRRVVAPSTLEETRTRNRRGPDNRSSSPKKTNANEQIERQRTESRENFLRKVRNFPLGRSSGGPNRSDPSGAHGTDNRGAKRRSDYKSNMFKVNRWIL